MSGHWLALRVSVNTPAGSLVCARVTLGQAQEAPGRAALGVSHV